MFSTSSRPIEEMWARYWDEEWWRKYYEEDLGRLYNAAARILAMREELSKMLAGKTLAQILEEPDQNKKEMYLKILLGGHDMKNNQPKLRSLSKFYREILGIGIYDIEVLISLLKQVDLKTAAKEIYINTREVEFVKDVKDILNILKTIYRTLYTQSRLKPPEVEGVEIKDPKDPVEAVVEFFNAARAILPLYNRVSFFIQSLRNIPKFYAKMEYGEKLFDKEVQNLLNKWGVSMMKIVEPIMPDKYAEENSIWGLSEKCPAQEILKLIDKIYHMTQPNHGKRIGILEYINLEDERNLYCKTYVELVRSNVKAIVDSIDDEQERRILEAFFKHLTFYRRFLDRDTKLNVVKGGLHGSCYADCYKDCWEDCRIHKYGDCHEYCKEECSKRVCIKENYFLLWGTFIRLMAVPFFTGLAHIEKVNGSKLKIKPGPCSYEWLK